MVLLFQRNHIACAILVWLRLKDLAYKIGQIIYQIKHGLLSNYLQDLRKPKSSLRLKRSVGKQSQDFCDYVAIARNDGIALVLRKS